MNYFVFSRLSDFINDLINKIGVDTFVSISVILWIFVFVNIFRKGTRF